MYNTNKGRDFPHGENPRPKMDNSGAEGLQIMRMPLEGD